MFMFSIKMSIIAYGYFPYLCIVEILVTLNSEQAMTKCFFAVDLGATSGRTIIGSFTQEGLVTEEMNRFPNHIIETGGHFYWDIYELYRNILEGLKRAAARQDIEITSIGIDTWGVDFVCVGKDGNLLRQPYSYRDPHTEGAPEKYFAENLRVAIWWQRGQIGSQASKLPPFLFIMH